MSLNQAPHASHRKVAVVVRHSDDSDLARWVRLGSRGQCTITALSLTCHVHLCAVRRDDQVVRQGTHGDLQKGMVVVAVVVCARQIVGELNDKPR